MEKNSRKKFEKNSREKYPPKLRASSHQSTSINHFCTSSRANWATWFCPNTLWPDPAAREHATGALGEGLPIATGEADGASPNLPVQGTFRKGCILWELWYATPRCIYNYSYYISIITSSGGHLSDVYSLYMSIHSIIAPCKTTVRCTMMCCEFRSPVLAFLHCWRPQEEASAAERLADAMAARLEDRMCR